MKKFINIIGLLASFMALLSFAPTEFFSSMTKIDYLDSEHKLKFTTKINSEHISQAIGIRPETTGFEAEVKRYVNKNFSVSVNGSVKTLTFTGSQVNGDAVWVYFEAGDINSVSKLGITNSLLVDRFPKQFNVVNIDYKGSQKTINFTKTKTAEELSF